MYCPICGAMINQGSDTCQYCGTKVNSVNNVNNQGYQSAPNNSYQQSYQPSYQQPVRQKYSKKYSILSMVFGAVSIEFAALAFYPILGLIFILPCFIVFSALSKSFKNKHFDAGYPSNGFVKAGKILSTIAIPVGIVMTLFGLILTIALISAS